MTLLLLDTTFLIDAERTDDQLDQAIGDGDDVAIAAVTVAELQFGARLATGRRRAQRQRFVDDVCDVIPILSYDRPVAAEHAELLVAVCQVGRPRGAHDLIIAATSLLDEASVGDQRPVDHVGQLALQGPAGFCGVLAFGAFAVVVPATLARVGELSDGNDVERMVQLGVAELVAECGEPRRSRLEHREGLQWGPSGIHEFL